MKRKGTIKKVQNYTGLVLCFHSDFIHDNAIEVTNKHAPRWEVELPRIQDYILSTTYGMLPLRTFTFPTDREVTPKDMKLFQQHQCMAMVAASGFNVTYELIGNLRNADWYNQVSSWVCSSPINNFYAHPHIIFPRIAIPQFYYGVPFKHLKLITTNRFGEHITSLDMAAATTACKDAYKAWCHAKGKSSFSITSLQFCDLK
jgi:hypothetical protein